MGTRSDGRDIVDIERRSVGRQHAIGLGDFIDLAEDVLAPGGAFLAKVLQGGAGQELVARLRLGFAKVQHVKPKASRADSAEVYVLATGFRGSPQ